MDIITGYTGKKHITAEKDRDINIGIVGGGSYVLCTGMQMKAEISTNNEIKIRDGVIMHQGCAASIKKNTYDSVTIINGSQGMKRIDLIVARYERNKDTNVESLELVALQGEPAESDPAVPDFVVGDIQEGDYVADMLLYQVMIDGLNIVDVKQVFELAFDLKTVKEAVTELNGNSIIEVVTTSSGTAIKYANGLVEEFGRAICQNANGNVAMASVNLPVSLDMQKPYAAFCSKDPMGNSENATRVTTAASLSNSNSALFELQTPNPFLGSLSDAYRTISWSVKGFWK